MKGNKPPRKFSLYYDQFGFSIEEVGAGVTGSYRTVFRCGFWEPKSWGTKTHRIHRSFPKILAIKIAKRIAKDNGGVLLNH